MAAIDVTAWVPEPSTSEVIQRVNQMSAVERLARREPMTALTKSVPRSGGADVAGIAKSASYAEDGSTDDDVVLTAKKFGSVFRIPEEDLNDALPNVIATKQRDWATSYAKFIDNACLGTDGGSQGVTRPFVSVYQEVADYNSSSNLVQTGAGGTGDIDPPSYEELSQVVGVVEEGDYWDESAIQVIAHPIFRGYLREVLDSQDRPIFIQGVAGTPDTLFGLPIAWSQGARKSENAAAAPTGNPLLVVANTDLLMLGVRSGPESVFIDGRSGASAMTDEALLKMRARRGFAVGRAAGFGVLEATPS